MAFDDELVDHFLAMAKCDTGGSPAEKRARAATKSEELGNHLLTWEIRTGRSCSEMTIEEAIALVMEKPQLIRNPGMLSKLLKPEKNDENTDRVERQDT